MDYFLFVISIKLDSNGTNPKMLKDLIDNNMIDCIAMDIKHQLNFKLYNQTVGNWINEDIFEKILSSIDIIKKSKIDYEFRTTIAKGLHTKNDIKILKELFGKNYQIQNFNPEIVLNKYLEIEPFSESEYEELLYL